MSIGANGSLRVLVSGRDGQLGRALVERAVVARSSAAALGLTLIAMGRSELDLASEASIAAVVAGVRPDIIVNAAAYTAVDRAEDEVGTAERVNAEAPGWLATAAGAVGARLIHVSTDYVYDGRKSTPYVESDATGPQSVYGRTKLEGEQRALAGLAETVVLRTAWVYSPFGRNFVRTMLDLARSRPRLTVVDDQHGNPTSALDLADAVLAIADHWQKVPSAGLGGVYHCAGSGATTWCGLARHTLQASRTAGGPFAEVTGIATADWPTKAVRPANSRLDCTKLARDFGWQAPAWQSSVEVVVKRLLAGATC